MKAIAAAWLREADWSRWRELDAGLNPDFANYRASFEAKLKQIEAAGYRVQKIEFGPDEFMAWSIANLAGKVDSNARAAFAAYLAQKKAEH